VNPTPFAPGWLEAFPGWNRTGRLLYPFRVMDLNSLVSQICDQADDFLGEVRKRDEAKAGIAEWLTIHHLKLPPADKKAVIEQAMRILDKEGFFEHEAGADE
jgi:hypothetical protein